MTAATSCQSAPAGLVQSPAGLAVHGLTFGHERHQPPLIEGFSAALTPGRVCALLGPNAAGKSTLLRLMLGELAPWQGQVTLDGAPVTALSAPVRAQAISHVPQRGGTGFAFTVEQVVAMGRHALTAMPGVADDALRRCDLWEVRHRVFAHLSVGQQQRALLARAIAQSRGGGRVMLLDEPGSAMDLRHVHRMMTHLAQVAREDGLAVLVVLHDVNLAARYADDVWLMDRGRLIAAGPWQATLDEASLSRLYGLPMRRLADMHASQAARPVFIADDAQYTDIRQDA